MNAPTRRRDTLGIACGAAAAAVMAAFVLLAVFLLGEARSVANPAFLLDAPSRAADRAGVGPALAGTLWLAMLTAALALPIGIGTAIYLEEYASRNRLAALVGSALAGLTGVPSVVYGVAGLALFVRGLGMGPSILAGGCTLAVLALPTVIVTSRVAIRAVPEEMRLAAYSLGATRWQVVRGEVLPAAAPGIVAGSCHALTRTIGEAAPLLVLGAAAFMTFAPHGPGDPLTSLPTRIFAWTTRSEQDFAALAAGAGIALLLVLLLVNLAALAVRRRMRGGAR
ncbi:MAG: phosphate ABC transporter permease PstA [Gemmatimonadota bacterium]|nr:phosphate ABC transporter permease PstA [Gemmatimonadota bacterium]MDE2871692.1 phosphate ABC transporter permease PstA [Gemmatimonadota bacterium]